MTRSITDTGGQWADPARNKQMRDNEPVWQDPDTGMWHVFRYQDVATVLNEHETFSSDFSRLVPDRAELAEGNILAMDPPRHHRLRRLVSRAFTPRAIAELEGRIAELTAELLDQTGGQGHLELVSDLAYPLPVIVIAELLGVPAEDRALFKTWADVLLSRENSNPTDQETLDQAAQDLGRFHDYLRDHVARRQRQPREDLLGNLVTAEIDGERLDEQEIVGFATVLLLAGHITTTVLLGNTVRCLDEYPDVQLTLRTNPDIIPAAIEEVLRFRSPFAAAGRVTATSVELSGRTIPADQFVTAMLASANRDERQFNDPYTFVLDRSPNPHLGFGKGIHFCIGAPLARLESKIALEILLRRYADLRVDHDHPLEPYLNPGVNGTRTLHLQVEPA
jgi:cytochrome P450